MQPDRDKAGKVFGIGFHKTGTTTLGRALELLGYNVCHGAAPVRHALGHRRMIELLSDSNVDEILEVAERYDAFEDNPWFVLYRELDAHFPGSRFILTIRNDDSWLASALRYYGNSESDLRWWIYGVGSPVGNESTFLERYRRHNIDVSEYFRDRPRDLLVVDWETGDGWPQLSAFLDRPAPDIAFPHVNRSHDR